MTTHTSMFARTLNSVLPANTNRTRDEPVRRASMRSTAPRSQRNNHLVSRKNDSFSRAPEIQGIVERCVAIAGERVGTVNDLTLKELVAGLDKIKHSVQRHSGSGSRSYDVFIKPLLR